MSVLALFERWLPSKYWLRLGSINFLDAPEWQLNNLQQSTSVEEWHRYQVLQAMVKISRSKLWQSLLRSRTRKRYYFVENDFQCFWDFSWSWISRNQNKHFLGSGTSTRACLITICLISKISAPSPSNKIVCITFKTWLKCIRWNCFIWVHWFSEWSPISFIYKFLLIWLSCHDMIWATVSISF